MARTTMITQFYLPPTCLIYEQDEPCLPLDPSHTALLPFGQDPLPVPLRIGSWVGQCHISFAIHKT